MFNKRRFQASMHIAINWIASKTLEAIWNQIDSRQRAQQAQNGLHKSKGFKD